MRFPVVFKPFQVKLQQKYDAMGLPDPVAFALLVALGAVRDPMAMLNEMMARQEEASASRAARGEAADSLELLRLQKQAREAAEHARVAHGLASEVAPSTRDVRQAFGEEEEPPKIGTTLSSMLTGRDGASEGGRWQAASAGRRTCSCTCPRPWTRWR